MATPAPSLPTTTSSPSPLSQLTPTTTTTITSTPTPLNAPTTSSGFVYPREWSFPPFFTRQPNANTRHAQDAKWASLVLAYCSFHRVYKLGLSSPAADELFHNKRLNKRLSHADAREVFNSMRRDGRVEFIGGGDGSRDEEGEGGGGDVVWVYWRTPEEWAALIEAWVDETAQKGTVLTLYELSQGEDTVGTEFHGLDPELLQKALQMLVKRNKAQIFGQEDQLGVKFF
ncbi:ESCRT-II complex, vps25 subunit [Astrocystis sublimbata]|nr:ESCRT-II complex, vps25 subunit [Astrocystis sublimbata]